MTKKTCLLMLLAAMLSLLTSGCIAVEQEIFLAADGSGDMVMHISLPDIPDAIMKNSPAAGAGQPDPKAMLEELKKKFSSNLPPTVQLKEAKEVKRNGAFGYYIVLHFKQLNDLEAAMDSFSKEGLAEQGPGEAKKKDESYWKVFQEKKGDLTTITQRLFIDMSDMFGKDAPAGDKEKAVEPVAPTPPPAPKAEPKPPAKRIAKRGGRTTKPAAPVEKEKEEFPDPPMPADPFKGLMDDEAMKMIFSSIFKFRFIVHAPKDFTETNADIVLNGKTAIWNASFGAFIGEKDSKEKKILEMKVVY
jgi:hypothetical protein